GFHVTGVQTCALPICMGKIFMAAPLNPKDLAPLVKTSEVITWDTRKGGMIARRELRIGSIVLQSKPLPSPDPTHLTQAISTAIKIGRASCRERAYTSA